MHACNIRASNILGTFLKNPNSSTKWHTHSTLLCHFCWRPALAWYDFVSLATLVIMIVWWFSRSTFNENLCQNYRIVHNSRHTILDKFVISREMHCLCLLCLSRNDVGYEYTQIKTLSLQFEHAIDTVSYVQITNIVQFFR